MAERYIGRLAVRHFKLLEALPRIGFMRRVWPARKVSVSGGRTLGPWAVDLEGSGHGRVQFQARGG